MKSIRKIVLLGILLTVCIFSMAACSQKQDMDASGDSSEAVTEDVQEAESSDDAGTDADEETITMRMKINDTDVKVAWENNDAVKALAEMAAKGDVTIQMNAYGGFEQVGPSGTALPGNDTNIKTKAGDIMLYTSDHMVIFYGSNSWSYTRLGHITDKSSSELKDLLSGSSVTVTVSAE